MIDRTEVEITYTSEEQRGKSTVNAYLTRACLQTSYRSQISEAARHTKAAKTSASLS